MNDLNLMHTKLRIFSSDNLGYWPDTQTDSPNITFPLS